ncbi:hypothetical protein BDEG_21070 [Batrachochytrium dendrobatidis JEL423]|uniref:Cytochrome c oxidase subunit 6B n=1 Tax=Batrachochytrium dendrobatidis (strain JEL423) TaxID=403673 RepID=A0A177WA77_BATDL|nr:hypothetical protein BDEG_21070 [Batrachochytrium dendrobatidis JEL423]
MTLILEDVAASLSIIGCHVLIDAITRNCWQNYVDFHKCVQAKGEDFQPCQEFKAIYRSLCPTNWTDQWDEQREENVFPPLNTRSSPNHH